MIQFRSSRFDTVSNRKSSDPSLTARAEERVPPRSQWAGACRDPDSVEALGGARVEHKQIQCDPKIHKTRTLIA